MIWIIWCVVLTRQPNFGLGKRRNLNTSNLDLLKTTMRAAPFALVSWSWWGESFHSIWLDSNVPNLNVFRTDVAQFFQLSIDCIVKAVLEQRNSAHRTISVSLTFTCHSLNIDFQSIFCIFSMSCSWAGLPRVTGYSPKYIIHLLPMDWTSFVPKTTCECSSIKR